MGRARCSDLLLLLETLTLIATREAFVVNQGYPASSDRAVQEGTVGLRLATNQTSTYVCFSDIKD
jgi:hypothetical protein